MPLAEALMRDLRRQQMDLYSSEKPCIKVILSNKKNRGAIFLLNLYCTQEKSNICYEDRSTAVSVRKGRLLKPVKSVFRDVGALLRSRRQEKGLSLREVENEISIRSLYLEALEEGTITQHVAGVYVQGFLKQYASFLDLSVEQLMEEYPVAFQHSSAKENFRYGIGTLEVRFQQQSQFSAISKWIWIISLLLIVLLGYYFLY